MWSIRPDGDGMGVVDGTDAGRAVEPAPITTIAWRLWHLSVDCLDNYRHRFEGAADAPTDVHWHLTTQPAVAAFQTSWDRYRACVTSRGPWWDELGADWGPWSRHSIVDMVLHASNEVVHHAAEIALLRDLYARR